MMPHLESAVFNSRAIARKKSEKKPDSCFIRELSIPFVHGPPHERLIVTNDAHRSSSFPLRTTALDLLAILARSRRAIILAISLVVIENVAWIVEPTIFGQTIDALIDGEGKGLAGMEDMYDIFQERNPAVARDYFNRLVPVQLRIALWGSRSFLFMRFFLLFIFLAVLYISIDLDNFSAGDIYTIVAYLWTFVTSTEYVPELLESWTSLKDINRRLKGVEERKSSEE